MENYMKNLCIILVSISLAFAVSNGSNYAHIDNNWYGYVSSLYFDQGEDWVSPGNDDQINRKRRHKRRRKMRPSKKGLGK